MLICRNDYDIKLIPPECACERDILEIRVQLHTDAASASECDVDFYLDAAVPENRVESRRIQPVADGWTLVTCRLPLRGRTGDHRIVAELRMAGETRTVSRAFQVKPYREARLDGGFIMIGPPNDRQPCDSFRSGVKSLTDAQWEEQITAWNAMGMRSIIITATYQPLTLKSGALHAHYPSQILPQTPDLAAVDPVAAILRAAERNGQSVFIGLGHFGESERLDALLDEIFTRYGKFTSFYGWYGSMEFATAWCSWDGIGAYWAKIRARANQLSPVMPLLISPYQPSLTLDMDPETDFQNPEMLQAATHCGGPHPALAEFLRTNPDRPDILMPQDGAGMRLPTPRHADLIERNHRHFAAFREATDAAGIHLWCNVESFDFAPDSLLVPRYANGGFDGADGFVQQLDSTFRTVEQLLTFSLPGFFATPGVRPEIGGAAALEQGRRYDDYRKNPLPAGPNLALGKKYTITPPPSQLLADNPFCGKLTDGRVSGGWATAPDDDRLIGFDSRQADAAMNLEVVICVDLGTVQKFDHFRLGGAVRRLKGHADALRAAVSTDRTDWVDIGGTDHYDHGWLVVRTAAPAAARYLQLTLTKHFHSDINRSWQDCWLLLDELEIFGSKPI